MTTIYSSHIEREQAFRRLTGCWAQVAASAVRTAQFAPESYDSSPVFARMVEEFRRQLSDAILGAAIDIAEDILEESR